MPYIDMNQPWIYMCSPSRSPLPPPSPSHPSGSSQCTSPEHLSHASNLDWWSVSPLIIYMFHAVLSDHPTLPFQLWVGSVKWWKLEEKTAHSTITRQVFSLLRIIHSPWPPLWVPSSLCSSEWSGKKLLQNVVVYLVFTEIIEFFSCQEHRSAK